MSRDCFECGESGSICDHHVVPRSRGGTMTVPLCVRCHGLAHNIDIAGSNGVTAQALRAKRERGERVGSVRYGYRLADDAMTEVPDCAEQAVIQKAKDMRAAGLSLRAIGAELAAAGMYPRSGGKWAPTQINRMVAGDT